MKRNSRRIQDWDGPSTGFTINAAVGYLDTITFFCWHPLPEGMLGSLRKQYGRRLFVEVYTLPVHPERKRWFITIHQPKQATLRVLGTIQQGRFVVHAVHIAIDFLCANSRQARLATAFLTRGVVQKWRRRDQRSHLEANTRYWNLNRRVARNIALYGDRRSKTGQGDCAHLELRFTSSAACKRAGLGKLSTLIRGIDAIATLEHQMRIALIDPTRLDRAIETISRRQLRKKQRQRPHLTVSKINEKLRRLLARALQDECNLLDDQTIAKARSQALWDYLH